MVWTCCKPTAHNRFPGTIGGYAEHRAVLGSQSQRLRVAGKSWMAGLGGPDSMSALSSHWRESDTKSLTPHCTIVHDIVRPRWTVMILEITRLWSDRWTAVEHQLPKLPQVIDGGPSLFGCNACSIETSVGVALETGTSHSWHALARSFSPPVSCCETRVSLNRICPSAGTADWSWKQGTVAAAELRGSTNRQSRSSHG